MELFASIYFTTSHAREKVDVTDEAGNVWHNMRVTVKAYAYVPHFSKAYKLTLEFWRV